MAFNVEAYMNKALETTENNIHVVQKLERFMPIKDSLYIGRFISYISEGIHKNEKFNSESDTIRLEFEIYSVDEDENKNIISSDGKYPVVSRFVSNSYSEKSALIALGKAMDPASEFKQLYQMLGKVFRIDFLITENKEEPSKSTYRIQNVKYPVEKVLNPTGKGLQTVNYEDFAPETTRQLQLFLWNHPDIGAWDALFREGFFDNKSKNYVQNRIREAVNFVDSPIYKVLEKAGRDPFTDYDENGNIIYKHAVNK